MHLSHLTALWPWVSSFIHLGSPYVAQQFPVPWNKAIDSFLSTFLSLMGLCWRNILCKLSSDIWLLVQCAGVFWRASWDKPWSRFQPYLPHGSVSTCRHWDMGFGCSHPCVSSTGWGPASLATLMTSCHGPAAPAPLRWSQPHPGSLQNPGTQLGKNAREQGHPERGLLQAWDPGSSLGAQRRHCLSCQPIGEWKCLSPPPQWSATLGHSRGARRKDFHRNHLGSGIPAGALHQPAAKITQMAISKAKKSL